MPKIAERPRKKNTDYIAGIPLDPQLKDRIDVAASAECRKRAQMMRVLLIEALDARDSKSSNN